MTLSLEETKSMLSHLHFGSIEVSNRVSSFMNNLRSLIDSKERELLEYIENYRGELEKKLCFDKDRLGHLLATAKHCSEYTNHLLYHGNSVEIASTSQRVLSRLSTLLSLPIAPQFSIEPTLRFTETLQEEKKAEIETLLGSLDQLVSVDSSCKLLSGSASIGHISADSGSHFIPDYSSLNSTIQELGSLGKEDLQFNRPSGMTVDHNDRIYVADSENHRIQCLDSQGAFLFQFGSQGNKDGQFCSPKDVSFDPKNQRLLVADTWNDRIQTFGLDGTFQSCFGAKGEGNGEFDCPFGIASNREGNIFVTDYENHRVQVFDETGNFLFKFEHHGNESKEIQDPCGIAFLSNGHIVLSEMNSVSIFDSQGRFLRSCGEGQLTNPWWIFVDSQDNILVSDNGIEEHSIFVFSKEGELLSQIGSGLFEKVWGIVMNSKRIFVSGIGKDGQHRIFLF